MVGWSAEHVVFAYDTLHCFARYDSLRYPALNLSRQTHDGAQEFFEVQETSADVAAKET